MDPQQDKNWKLKLRYGGLTTPYHHYSLIVDGEVLEETERNGAAHGPAVMGFKCWSASHEEAFDMAEFFAGEFCFSITGRIELYDTEPKEPLRDKPYGYDFGFNSYSREVAEKD